MQNVEVFPAVKKKKEISLKIDIFLIFAQNIDCGYTLEPPLPQFCYIKVGFNGVYSARSFFLLQ